MKHLILVGLLCLTFSNMSIANLIPSEKLFASPYASMIKFAPDGERVSMIANTEGKRQFSITTLTDNKQYLVENMGEVNYIKEYEWVNDSLIHLKSNTGQYFATLSFKNDNYHADIKKVPYPGYVTHIFAETKQVLFAKSKPWESGGFTLHLESIDDLVNKKLNVKKQIPGPRKRVSYFAFDPQRQHIIASMFDKDDKSITIEYRSFSKNNWLPLLTLYKTDYKFTPLALINDSTLAVLTNKETDKIALFEYDLQSNSLGKLLYEHPKFDLISARFQSTESGIKPLWVSYYDHGRFTIEYLQKRSAKESSFLANKFAEMQWYVAATHAPSNQQIIRTFASNDPGGYHLYNKDQGEPTLLYPMYPALEGFDFAKTKVTQVQVTDEIQVESYLTKATGKTHNVLLVNPHGGPVGVREDTLFDPNVQFYANRGFDVLQVNFRGSAGFGKKFLESGKGQFGKAIEQDITASVKQVMKTHQYDHICATGSSYGGYSSAMLAIQHPDVYDCVVAAYGIYDLPLLYNASNLKVSEQYRKRVVGIVGDYSEELNDVSPVYLADKLKAPIFLIAGRRDKIAEFEHSSRFHYMLERLNKPVETLFYWSTGHGHSKWRAEIHEQLSVHEYLINTLQLDRFWDDTDQQSQKDTLNNEYMLLADAFTFVDSVDNDSEKAAAYLEKAAAMGNSRAMYNYAVQAANNENEEHKIEHAIGWYKKADQAEYKKASFALAQLYREGEKVDQDYTKAYTWFTRSQELDYGQKADFAIARALCLGQGVVQDIDACLAVLSQRRKSEEEDAEKGQVPLQYIGNDTLLKAFKDILFSERLTPAQYDKIKQHIKYEFRLENIELELDVDDLGAFNTYEHLETTHNISANRYKYFGIHCDINTTKTFSKNYENIALLYKWTQYNAQDQIIDVVSKIMKDYEGEFKFKYQLPDQTTEASRITLEVFDLERNVIFTDAFNIIP